MTNNIEINPLDLTPSTRPSRQTLITDETINENIDDISSPRLKVGQRNRTQADEILENGGAKVEREVRQMAERTGAYVHQIQKVRAPITKYMVTIPNYMYEEISEVAKEENVTIKYIILQALQSAGYSLDEVDNHRQGKKLPKR